MRDSVLRPERLVPNFAGNICTMVTDSLIKKRFVQQVVRRDAAMIYDRQASALRENFTNQRAHQLASFLSSHPYSVNASGLGFTYTFKIYPLLRFLDIRYSYRRQANRLFLYNGIVWPTLYRRTMITLRYGLSKDIKRQIREELQKISPDRVG